MRKTTILLLVGFLLAMSFSLSVPNGTCTTPQVQVDKVDHVITPVYGGLLLINDTIRISPVIENAIIEEFSIGFPLEYKANFLFAIAYNAQDSSKQLDVNFDTGIGAIGYYGITVSFSDEVSKLIYDGESFDLTVVFVFSDLIQSSTRIINATGEYLFTADFPLYPSLAYATTCNVTIILPENTTFVPDDLPFTGTEEGERYHLNYTEDIPSFARVSGSVSFVSESDYRFACFAIDKLSREVVVDAKGHIYVSELILMKSKTAFPISKIRIRLPDDAENVAAFNERGDPLSLNIDAFENDTYEIAPGLRIDETKSFRLNYRLDMRSTLFKAEAKSYKLNLSLLENLQMAPKTFTLKIVFPEGADLQSFPQQIFNIEKDIFQESITLSLSNITWLQNDAWSFTYTYSIFWASFRPTLWATTIVIIGFVVAFAWQRPRAPKPVSIVLVPRKILDEFVEIYEERKRTRSKIEATKQQAKKGKISRRRYKIRRTTLENQVSTLTKKLEVLRHRVISGGAKYADTMRQLEVAEVELENIEADIKRIEVRFKRGGISAQTYRRLLEDDLRRQERARTTIDGVLLRLRE